MPGSSAQSSMPPSLSGVVVGVLLNHRPALAALGAAADLPPHKGAPRAPVLQVKPHNTQVGAGASVVVPAGTDALEAGASLGIVIGRTACRLTLANALDHVAGYTVINDVRVPHDSHYRPSVRQRARDGFCPISPVVPATAVPAPDALTVRTEVDGGLAHLTDTRERVRDVARLLVDVTDFMTLQPSDVLMLGPSHGAPLVRAGQTVTITIDGVGVLTNRFVAEEAA